MTERIARAARGDHGSPRRAAVDDPVSTRIHNLREVRADQEVYQQNTSGQMAYCSRRWSLAGTRDCFDRARELAVQMSSEQFSTTQRVDAAITAEAIFERALEHANAQFGERYIFAGESCDAGAYDATRPTR